VLSKKETWGDHVASEEMKRKRSDTLLLIKNRQEKKKAENLGGAAVANETNKEIQIL
jgi:hypothetical protein